MRSYITGFFKEFDFPQEAQDELIACYDKIRKTDAWDVFETYISQYEETDKLDWHLSTDAVTEAAKQLGVHEYTSHLIFLICLTKHARELYERNGYSYEMFKTTFSDLKYKLLECHRLNSIWGNEILRIWYGRFFELNLFGFGRFQFEKREFWDANGYEKDGKKLALGDLVINIHIPSDGRPLTKELIDDAFSQAYDFYKDFFDDGIVPFTLRSWLLYDKHREFLPPSSNILKLMDYFDIWYSTSNTHFGDWWRIFYKHYRNNVDEMPTDTSLQRAYVGWIKKGNLPGSGWGMLLYKK